jgi:hypothetical protein
MRPNLIFLEDHYDRSCREFLINNIKELKKLGYQTIMFEFDATYTADQYKTYRQAVQSKLDNPISPDFFSILKSMLGFPSDYPNELLIENNRSHLRLLEAVESVGMTFVCIDPARRQDINMQKLVTQSGPFNLGSVQQRDIIMSEKILVESRKQHGGVIFVGGAAHNSLVHLLDKEKTVPTTVVIMANKELRDSQFFSSDPATDLLWRNLKEVSMRYQFYGREVHYFDEAPSFYVFDNFCRITAQLDLSDKLDICVDTPEVGRRLNAATRLPFTYTVDEHHILHAHLKSFNGEQLKTIQFALSHAFPGLPTFFRVHQKQAELVVKGINLSDAARHVWRLTKSSP